MVFRFMFTKKVIIRFLLLIIALGFFGPGAGARPLARYLPGEILVKFKPAANQPQVKLASFPAGATVHRSFPELGWKLIKLPQGMSVEQALAEFQARGDVAEVEPNYRIELHAATNDPRLSSLWGLSKIGAIEAWDYVKNPAAVVVAVLDTGVNHRHPDLAPNMWRNPLEIPANNRDDDNNGYVDDLHGIDVMSGDSDPFDEDDGHGSHVAGTIGAVSNNGIGVAGVNPFVQILAVRIFSADSFSGTAAVASAYDYLIALKKRGVNIRVVNNSWGGAFPSKAILDAVCAASDHGILSVCSAGNDRHDTDHAPAFPANYDCDGVLSVAASTEQDEAAIFSNFGLRTVHLAAPGDGILSTYKGKPDYATLSGTSMASPHVAGAAALLLARKPDLSIGDLRALLLGSVDRLPAWENKVVSHGRLNLLKAMQNLANNTLPTLPQTADGFPISIASRNSLGRLGNDKSLRSGVSADGRFIAFTSDATNLVSNDRNGKTDIFLHDRETRTTLRVTQTIEGVEANGESTDLVISGNGQFIAFQSTASNLVPGDNNGLPDIFVYDRMTRQIELISIASTGGIGNGESGAPSLSADGRYVAFASDASNLVPNDTNRRRDVFVRDRQQRTTTRVSINSAGLPGNGTSDFPWMSKDGRYVAFHTDSNNLIANDFNEAYDIYLHDRNLRVTQIVSVNSSGALGNDSSGFPCVSADGRFVAFQSFAGNLEAGGVSGVWEIYLRDLQNGTTRRISVSAGGARPDESAFRPVMSADGRWIAFESNANTLVPGPYQSIWSIFLHDRLTGRLMRLPINAGGEAPLDNSFLPWISETGRFLSFMSWAFNVAPGDGNATTADIFVFDRGTSIPDLMVRKTGDALFTGAGVLGAAQVQRMTQAVTPSGTVTFDVMLENAGPATEAFVLHATAPGAGWQLRVSDPQSRLITPEITSNTGWTSPALAPGNNLLLKCEITALAGPGDIKFALEINARTIGGTASLDRVFAVCTREAPPPHFFVASRNTSGTLGSDNSQEGVIDAEGNYVVFSSDAPNLAPNDENFDTDLFLWDRNAGVISCLS
ncbi:MAG: S8 family serine peptidase, partial [Verrucomicrobiota bacterium]